MAFYSKYKIGGVTLYAIRDKGATVYDNRGAYIDVEGGVVYEANEGHVRAGDSMEHTVYIPKADWPTIAALWTNHTATTWTEEDGTEEDGWYVIVKESRYIQRFPDYVELKISMRRV